MNRLQRTWLAMSFLVIGATLAMVALQWDARLPHDSGIRVVVLFEEEQTWSGQWPPCRSGAYACAPWERAWGSVSEPKSRPGDPWAVVNTSATFQHGIFVRRHWGAHALVWGGLLPLVLFGAAGFVALGRYREPR